MLETLSPDSQAVLLLCAHLQQAGEAAPPLAASEWRRAAARLREAGIAAPATLLEDANGLAWIHAGFSEDERERGRRLLQRGAQLSVELDQLRSRGIGIVTAYDDEYPGRLKERLGEHAPPFLYVVGDLSLAGGTGLAIVGSRNVDPAGAEFAREVARRCALSGLAVVSGGARGVDQVAMQGSLDEGGTAVGVMADSLGRHIRGPEVRRYLGEGTLLLLTPYHPDAGFSAGNAMGRNRFIYCMADYALVVATEEGSGGTWTGAKENLKHGWVPLFVRLAEPMAAGNAALLAQGGIPLPALDDLEEDLRISLQALQHPSPAPAPAPQLSLF